MRHTATLGLALLLSSGLAHAGAPFALESRGGPGLLSGPERWRLMYIGDNDSIGMVTEPETGFGYDRWYSTGTQLQLRHSIENVDVTWLPGLRRILLSANLAHNIYTPRNARIADSSELLGDRPYSGWLALGLGSELVLNGTGLSLGDQDQAFSHLGVDLYAGATGPWSLAGPVQHYAHEGWRVLAGQEIPPMVGWGKAETQAGMALDLAAFAETSLATFTVPAPSWMRWSGARPALHWRGGLRGDAGTTLVDLAQNTTLLAGWMGEAKSNQATFFPLVGFVYARAEMREVFYNATIQGQTIQGGPLASSAPVVGELSAGAVLRIYGLELSWVHAYRSNETASLPSAKQSGQLLWHWSVAWLW